MCFLIDTASSSTYSSGSSASEINMERTIHADILANYHTVSTEAKSLRRRLRWVLGSYRLFRWNRLAIIGKLYHGHTILQL